MSATESRKFTKSVVSTEDAKSAATELAQEGLKEILDQIWKIEKRDEQKEKLEQLRKRANPDTRHFLYVTKRREQEHYDFINKILLEIDEFKGKMQYRKEHDHSKDDLFFFTTASFYDGNIKGEKIDKLLKQELNRHYRLEPHHPEYERLTNRECTNVDITEMAVDRLCRNVQWGNGRVNFEIMEQYVPKFTLGETERKSEYFLKKAEKYRDFVESRFLEEFPEAKTWAENYRT